MIAKYGKYEVSGNNLVEVANKLSNHLKIGNIATTDADISTLVLKAVVRTKAEIVSREKRALEEGKEGKVATPKVQL
jgi:hypothetical protein